MATRTLTADRGDDRRRLDLVIRRHLTDVPDASRTRVQAWIAAGLVTVNAVPIRRVAARVALGDVVAVALRDAPPRTVPRAEDRPLDVLYEDEHLIAINKPPGVVVHPTYRHADGTLLNALLWRARTWPRGQRPSFVGRLDKLTSGLVIAAKTRRIHAALQRTMAAPGTAKEYLALVYGRVTPPRGAIGLRLARADHDRRRVVASPTHGAASLTRYERVARATAAPVGLALLRCRLATGRMHQIRVHLAARGWPIVGDPAYGEARWARVADRALAAVLRDFPRQALHASCVALTHPATGERLVITAPAPSDFSDLLAQCGFDPPGCD